MRVLHVTSTFPREAGGVGGTFLEDLVRAQAADGHDVTVVAPHDGGLDFVERWDGIEVRRFRYGPDRWETLAYRGGLMGTAKGLRGLIMVPLFLWGMFNGVLAATRDDKPDVVHAHWWLPAGLVGVFAAQRLGVPLVITCHGSDIALASRRRFLVRPLATWVLRRATVVGTVSEALKDQVKGVAGVEAAVLRMPLSLPPNAGTTTSTERGTGPFRVVATGRLSREKGFDVLIEALAQAPDVSVDLIGEGPELESLQARAKRLDLEQRLRFSGGLSRSEYVAKVAAADAVVVPSRHEGLGLVAVEALAAGKPVICSEVGGLPEVVGAAAETGAARLVKPDDPEALAAALRDLPMPRPEPESVASLIDGHRPETVAAAHRARYAAAIEAPRTAKAGRRFRPLRLLGAAAGLFLLIAVVTAVTDDVSDLLRALEEPYLGWLVAAGALALAAEVSFALGSATVGRTLVRPAPPMGPAAATYLVAQQAKHVPGGIWPAVARAGLSRRLHQSLGPRLAFVWVAGESLASVVAGMAAGGAVLVATSQAGLRQQTWGAIAVAAAVASLLVFALARQTLLARVLDLAGRPVPSLTALATAHLPAWIATGAASAALAAAAKTADLTATDLRVVAGAAVLASVAGFLALPVPAGLGVREAVFVALTAGTLGGPTALVVALAARLISLAAQVLLAAGAWPLIPKARNEGQLSTVDRHQAGESG